MLETTTRTIDNTYRIKIELLYTFYSQKNVWIFMVDLNLLENKCKILRKSFIYSQFYIYFVDTYKYHQSCWRIFLRLYPTVQLLITAYSEKTYTSICFPLSFFWRANNHAVYVKNDFLCTNVLSLHTSDGLGFQNSGFGFWNWP